MEFVAIKEEDGMRGRGAEWGFEAMEGLEFDFDDFSTCREGGNCGEFSKGNFVAAIWLESCDIFNNFEFDLWSIPDGREVVFKLFSAEFLPKFPVSPNSGWQILFFSPLVSNAIECFLMGSGRSFVLLGKSFESLLC